MCQVYLQSKRPNCYVFVIYMLAHFNSLSLRFYRLHVLRFYRLHVILNRLQTWFWEIPSRVPITKMRHMCNIMPTFIMRHKGVSWKMGLKNKWKTAVNSFSKHIHHTVLWCWKILQCNLDATMSYMIYKSNSGNHPITLHVVA